VEHPESIAELHNKSMRGYRLWYSQFVLIMILFHEDLLKNTNAFIYGFWLTFLFCFYFLSLQRSVELGSDKALF